MKILKIGLPVLLFVLVALVFLAPIGPLPGFRIGGTATPPPVTWPDTSSVHEIKLAVSGKLPRVVIIWVIQFESELYITGRAKSGWVKMLGSGGPVRMRLGDNTYQLVASAETEKMQPILRAYKEKYRADYPDIVAGFPSPEEARKSYVVFKLSRP